MQACTRGRPAGPRRLPFARARALRPDRSEPCARTASTSLDRDETVARPLRRVRPRLAVLPWWALVFGGLGVLATIAVLVALFTPVGRWPPRFTAPDLPAVDSEAVPRGGRRRDGEQRVQAGGTAELFDNGDAFYAAMLADIGAAGAA